MNDAAIITREQDVLRWALEREIVAPIEDAGDFYRHAHAITWAAILELRARGAAVDYLTVRAELDRAGRLETVGAAYLLELSRDSVRPSDAALLTAAAEIKQAATTRRLRNILAQFAVAPQIDTSALSVALAAFEGREITPALLDDAAVLNLPEPEPLVAGMIFERTLVAVVGAPGVGKTFVALALGLAQAAGCSAWLGAPIVKHGPAIYIAAEGAPAPRIGGWKVHHGYDLNAPLGLHTWSGAVNLLDPLAVALFIGKTKALHPRMVILDTFARCFVGGDENSARDVGIAVAALDRIRTGLDATVVVLHHMNKGGTSERGSGALRGACDTVMYLQQADDLLQLTCDKQKDAEPFEPVTLKLIPAFVGSKTCVVKLGTDVEEDDQLSDAQGKALHALCELFGDTGATMSEWETAIPSMARATFYRARKVLIDRGYVRVSDEGKSSRYRPTKKQAVSRRITAVSSPANGQSHGVSRSVSPDLLAIS